MKVIGRIAAAITYADTSAARTHADARAVQIVGAYASDFCLRRGGLTASTMIMVGFVVAQREGHAGPSREAFARTGQLQDALHFRGRESTGCWMVDRWALLQTDSSRGLVVRVDRVRVLVTAEVQGE